MSRHSRIPTIAPELEALEDVIAQGRVLMHEARNRTADPKQARIQLDAMGKITKAVNAHTVLRASSMRIIEIEAKLIGGTAVEEKTGAGTKLPAPSGSEEQLNP